MMAMKKNIAIIAVLVISFVTSILCGTEQNDAGIDSIKIEEYTAVLKTKSVWILLQEHIAVYYRQM